MGLYMYTLSLNAVCMRFILEFLSVMKRLAKSQVLYNFRIEYRNWNREREWSWEAKQWKGEESDTLSTVKPLAAQRLIFARNMEQQERNSVPLLLPHIFPKMFVLSCTMCVW